MELARVGDGGALAVDWWWPIVCSGGRENKEVERRVVRGAAAVDSTRRYGGERCCGEVRCTAVDVLWRRRQWELGVKSEQGFTPTPLFIP